MIRSGRAIGNGCAATSYHGSHIAADPASEQRFGCVPGRDILHGSSPFA
jgi:hypothetical protein